MRVTGGEPDFSDRLTFTVDPEAEAVDLDDAVATFLIALFDQPAAGDTLTDGSG